LAIFAFGLPCCGSIAGPQPVIKIGLAGPFEGRYRYVGYDAFYAARLALREANAQGGVGGYNLELVAFDDQGTASEAQVVARNLALDPKVVAVVGHFIDESTRAAQALYEQAGLPLVRTGTLEGLIEGNETMLCAALRQLPRIIDDGPTAPQQDPLVGSREIEPFRLQLLTEEKGQLSCPDDFSDGLVIVDSGQLLPLSDSNVDAVVLDKDPVRAGETLRILRATGWQGLVLGGPALGSPLFSQIVDPEGVVFFSPYRWPDVEGEDTEFGERYQSLGPHVAEPGPFALMTYQAVQSLLQAIDASSLAGEETIRQTIAADFDPRTQDRLFFYRWTSKGTLKLIDEVLIK
jgi:branched-chain amino acid transport system substrate-binding protein